MLHPPRARPAVEVVGLISVVLHSLGGTVLLAGDEEL